MMPKILLFGEAGSGKDTIAQAIVKEFNGVSVAMSDPMKRFVSSAFHFDNETLFGPSSARNVIHPRFNWLELECCRYTIFQQGYGEEFVSDIFPGLNAKYIVENNLREWFDLLPRLSEQNGGLSARIVLQTLGTEFGRKVDPNVWVNYADKQLTKLLTGGYKYDVQTGLVESPGQNYDYGICTDGRFRNELLGFKSQGAAVIYIIDTGSTSSHIQGGVANHKSEQEQRTIPRHWFDAVYFNNKEMGFEKMRHGVKYMVKSLFDKTQDHFAATFLQPSPPTTSGVPCFNAR